MSTIPALPDVDEFAQRIADLDAKHADDAARRKAYPTTHPPKIRAAWDEFLAAVSDGDDTIAAFRDYRLAHAEADRAARLINSADKRAADDRNALVREAMHPVRDIISALSAPGGSTGLGFDAGPGWASYLSEQKRAEMLRDANHTANQIADIARITDWRRRAGDDTSAPSWLTFRVAGIRIYAPEIIESYSTALDKAIAAYISRAA